MRLDLDKPHDGMKAEKSSNNALAIIIGAMGIIIVSVLLACGAANPQLPHTGVITAAQAVLAAKQTMTAWPDAESQARHKAGILEAIVPDSSWPQEIPGRIQSHAWVYVDPATGCQYLEIGNAATPRLSVDGHQICDARATAGAVDARNAEDLKRYEDQAAGRLPAQ